MAQANDPNPMNYRAAQLERGADGRPLTFDADTRSIELTLATEAPVPMWDRTRGEVVPEVLLARGARFPKQVPLLDTHDRQSTKSVVGSLRELRSDGPLVRARGTFAKSADAQEVMDKYAEGHLTDFSAGYVYSANDVRHVPKGEEAEIGGRTWSGPVNVVTGWTIKEGSCCPIGADAAAKARAETPQAEKATPQETETMNDDRKEETAPAATETVREEYRRKAEELEEIRTAERKRQREIREMGKKLGLPTLAEELCERGVSAADAKDILYDKWMQDRATDAVTTPQFEKTPELRIIEPQEEKFRAAAIDALMFRTGTPPENFDAHAHEFSGISLFDLARNDCVSRSISVKGTKEEIIRRSMTSGDLSNILANVQNKYLYTGWEEAETTWQLWCGTGSIPDYKQASFPRPGAFPLLTETDANHGEYGYKAITDETENATIGHYGAIISLSLKAIMNDDLGAISDVPRLQGEAASRTVDRDVYVNTLVANTGTGVGETMGDGNALFDASNHANFVDSGSGGAPALSTLNTLAQYMAVQQDAGSNAYLGGQPQFILAHPYYRATIDNLLTDVNPNQVSATTSVNPWGYMQRVYTPWITANSHKWWAVAGARGKTVQVYGLNGPPRPMLDDQASWASAGWEYKVTLDFVTKAIDWRYVCANFGS